MVKEYSIGHKLSNDYPTQPIQLSYKLCLTQEFLATRLGVSAASVKHWESCKGRGPNYVWIAIGQALEAYNKHLVVCMPKVLKKTKELNLLCKRRNKEKGFYG